MNPRKVILSRKGFDTQAGGGASPVLEDGRMLSLPIPEPHPNTDGPLYSQLLDIDGTDYLTIARRLGHRRLGPHTVAHLDPDLVPTVRERDPRWRGLFGQIDASGGHLRRQGVGPGDLFLFWGLYQHAGGGRRSRRFHALFGYLEVAEVIDAAGGERVDFATYHPHFSDPYRRANNLVFVATERLSMRQDLPGWGTFVWSDDLMLSVEGRDLNWRKLPACFHPSTGATLTYHTDPALWELTDDPAVVHVYRRGNGQEFLAPLTDGIEDWTKQLFADAQVWTAPQSFP